MWSSIPIRNFPCADGIGRNHVAYPDPSPTALQMVDPEGISDFESRIDDVRAVSQMRVSSSQDVRFWGGWAGIAQLAWWGWGWLD